MIHDEYNLHIEHVLKYIYHFRWSKQIPGVLLCSHGCNANTNGKLTFLFANSILKPHNTSTKISVYSEYSFGPFKTFVDLVEILGVVTQLEKLGYSGEEILKAIHATEGTGGTDASITADSMICK